MDTQYTPEGYKIRLLKDLPPNSVFWTVDPKTLAVGKTPLYKEAISYNRSLKKYDCVCYEDIRRFRNHNFDQWVTTISGYTLSPDQWVTTDLIY